MAERSRIAGVGTFDEQGHPVGWVFKGGSTGFDVGLGTYGGWTADELRQVEVTLEGLAERLEGTDE